NKFPNNSLVPFLIFYEKAPTSEVLLIFCLPLLPLSHSIFSVAYNVFTAITNQKTVEDV
ncbi:MAG: hypothetical protein ACI8Z9_000293, partial [Paraglaciecola sp.]